MPPDTLDSLLRLAAAERARIALALWESLDDASRDGACEATPELVVELERRIAEHEADPHSALPWDEVRRRLMDRK